MQRKDRGPPSRKPHCPPPRAASRKRRSGEGENRKARPHHLPTPQAGTCHKKVKASKAICSHCGRRHPPTCKIAGAGRGSGNRKGRPHHLPTPQAGTGRGRRMPGECLSLLPTQDTSVETGHPVNNTECEHPNRSPRWQCEMQATEPVIPLTLRNASIPTGHPVANAGYKHPNRSSR